MDNFIHLVRSEMLVAASLLANNKGGIERKESNILETDIDTKKKIAKIWLNIFQDEKF